MRESRSVMACRTSAARLLGVAPNASARHIQAASARKRSKRILTVRAAPLLNSWQRATRPICCCDRHRQPHHHRALRNRVTPLTHALSRTERFARLMRSSLQRSSVRGPDLSCTLIQTRFESRERTNFRKNSSSTKGITAWWVHYSVYGTAIASSDPSKQIATTNCAYRSSDATWRRPSARRAA